MEIDQPSHIKQHSLKRPAPVMAISEEAEDAEVGRDATLFNADWEKANSVSSESLLKAFYGRKQERLSADSEAGGAAGASVGGGGERKRKADDSGHRQDSSESACTGLFSVRVSAAGKRKAPSELELDLDRDSKKAKR